MKKIIPFFLPLLALLTISCSEKAEQVSADEMAAQVEDAFNAGREAAKPFLNKEFKDTLELQNMLLEARSESSDYEIAGNPKAKAAFDSAFVATLRTVRPDIARAIETKPEEPN